MREWADHVKRGGRGRVAATNCALNKMAKGRDVMVGLSVVRRRGGLWTEGGGERRRRGERRIRPA